MIKQGGKQRAQHLVCLLFMSLASDLKTVHPSGNCIGIPYIHIPDSQSHLHADGKNM